MGEGSKKPGGQIRILQVVDKCAMRGATIHGMARLLITWWPAFHGTDFLFSFCVLRGREGGLSEFRAIGVDVIDLNRHKVDPRTILDLARIIRRDNIQIIHCHGYGSSTFGRIAAKICGISVIVHEHMIDENIPIYQKVADFLTSPLTTKGIAVSNAVADFPVYRSRRPRQFHHASADLAPRSRNGRGGRRTGWPRASRSAISGLSLPVA